MNEKSFFFKVDLDLCALFAFLTTVINYFLLLRFRSDWFSKSIQQPYWRGSYICKFDNCSCRFEAIQICNINRGQQAQIKIRIHGECNHDKYQLPEIRCDRIKRESIGPKLKADGIESVFTENIMKNFNNQPLPGMS